MRVGIASAEVFGLRSVTRAEKREEEPTLPRSTRAIAGWSADRFAQEQIRGLVRQVFSTSMVPPVRQVMFSAVDWETDVRGIGTRVAETLAMETKGDVAIVDVAIEEDGSRFPSGDEVDQVGPKSSSANGGTLRDLGKRMGGNLWKLPLRAPGDGTSSVSLHRHLGEIRREFEYSIIVGGPGGHSTDAMAVAQFADGVILVLSAQYTRRVAAVRVRDTLAASQARLLGTVLCDREFPIPERIYRQL